MPKFDDSLRVYSFEAHWRDDFRCVYCGLDGTQSFSNWLNLSEDHLLPKGHPHRDDPEFRAAACRPYNEADNRTLWTLSDTIGFGIHCFTRRR